MKEQFPKLETKPDDRRKIDKGTIMDKIARYDANLAAIAESNAKNRKPSKKEKRNFHASKIDEKLMEGNRYQNFKKVE
jgi:hypothetical protein